MYVVFENKGEIDITGVTAFGVSVKNKNDAIGYFGTGLKYATAILAREKQQMEIYSGGSTYLFETRKHNVRGVDFDMITMNGRDLSYTTELGKNWKMWQAFREIYCNTLDEGGSVNVLPVKPEPKEGMTYIIVKGEAFIEEYTKKDSIVFDPKHNDAILKTPEIEIYDKPSNYMYYRGVRIHELKPPSLFTYNIIKSQELTEDRTLKEAYAAESFAGKRTSMIKDPVYLDSLLKADKDESFEGGISYSHLEWEDFEPSPEFMSVAEAAFTNNSELFNKSAVEYFSKETNKQAKRNLVDVKLEPVEQMQLEKAVDIVSKVYPDLKAYNIRTVNDLGTSTMAFADHNTNSMVISKRCFEMGTKYLVSTMIEEYAHLKTGYPDHSRGLQTWLFDQVTSLIEKHVAKEPI